MPQLPRPFSIRAPGATRANMLIIAISYAVFAASLGFQPQRWARTPAYHNLLELMPQWAWAVVFAVVAVLLTVAVWRFSQRWLAVFALTIGIALTTCWAGAFVVRWLTSPNTTPETWVSWAVFDLLLIRAAALIDYEEVRVPETPGRDG